MGIEVSEADRGRVVTTVQLKDEHLTEFGAVQGGVVMAAADIAGAAGAVLNLQDGYATATLESKTNFLRHGKGDMLWAESSPIHVGQMTSVWRTQVWRGHSITNRHCIAEVVQTQLHVPERRSEDGPAPLPKDAEATASEEIADSAPDETMEDSEAADVKALSIAELRKAEILKGAIEVMSRKGFARASVREITEAAGMPVPTMYKYIRSKEDILELIYDNFLAEFHAQLGKSVSGTIPPMQRLAAALRATSNNFDKNYKGVRLLFCETRSLNDKSRQRIFKKDLKYIEQWTDIIIEFGLHKKLDIDAELLANFIYYITTVWVMRYWAVGKWGLPQVRRAMVRFVMATTGENLEEFEEPDRASAA